MRFNVMGCARAVGVAIGLVASHVHADHATPDVFLMNNNDPVTVTNCTGLFFDSGGPDDPYDFQAPAIVKVFAPADPATQKLRVEFTSFSTEPAFTRLDIFNGETTALGPAHFGFFDGTNSPGIITSTAPDGKLTFKWFAGSTPGFLSPFTGWKARIYCVPAYTAVFQTSGQSLWGPGVNTTIPDSARTLFLVIDFNELGQGTNIFNLLGKRFGGGFQTGTMADFRFFIKASDISPGSVAVRYPVQVTLAGPEKDQFRPGDLITIDSFQRIKTEDGPNLTTVTPEMIMNIDSVMHLTANVKAEVCFFSCKSKNLFPSFNLNAGPIPFIRIEDRVTDDRVDIVGGIVSGNTPLDIPFPVDVITGLSGRVDTPDLTISSSTLDGTALVAPGNHQFLNLDIDLDKYYGKAVGFPVPLQLSGIPVGGGVKASYLIADYDVITLLNQEFLFRFAPTVLVSLAFPQPVAFTVRRGATVLQSGVSAVVNFNPGDSIDLVAPAAAMNVIPTISLANPTFVNQNTTRLRRNYTLKGVGFGLKVPGVHLGCFPSIGPCPVCTPAFCANVPPLDLNFGPFLNITEPNADNTDTRLFGTVRREFPLGGFNTVIPGSPFEVNPEFKPVAVIDGPAGPVNEGDVLPFSAANSFDGDGNPLAVAWNFGDGGTGIGPTAGEIVTHQYGDNGTYNVTLVVDDGHGFPGVAHRTLVVNNVTPTLPLLSSQKVLEGDFARVFFGAIDPGFLDTFVTKIDWGDLSSGFVINTFGLINSGPVESLGYFYADNGPYTASYCFKDDDGGEACNAVNIEVNNADPTVSVAGFELTQQPSGAGDALEVMLRTAILFNDPGTLDTHTARIEWGEGTSDPFPTITESPFGPPGTFNGANGSGFGEFTHSYSTVGLFDVRVCVTDDDGGEGCTAITTVDVREANLAVTKEVIDPVPPADVVVGSDITYKLIITNNGPDEALDVRVTDLLPAGTALVSAVRGGAGVIETKLSASVQGLEDALGTSVAISGDTIVTGAPGHNEEGAAFVFRASGAVWTEQQKLNPSDPSFFSGFGEAVDVDGDTIAVGSQGARDDADPAVQTGAVYVYVETGPGWNEQAKLLAGDRLAGDGFGSSVGLESDTVVVGSPFGGDDLAADAGAVYVFGRTATVWTELAQLHPSTPVADARFGSDVSISGDTIVVAAPGDIGNGRPGTVTIFRGSGSTWTIERTIVEGDVPTLPEANTFAQSVSIDGDTLVVGTREQFASAQPSAAHVFVRIGTVWSEQAKLDATDAALSDRFARSVAVNEDTITIGSPRADGQGAVYVFGRNGSSWTQIAKLAVAATGTFDELGLSVAVEGQTIVGGAPGSQSVDMIGNNIIPGAAYVFAICPEQPPGTVTCGLGPLASGDSAVVEIVARVGCIHAPIPFVATTLTNTATVSSLALDPTPGNNTATTATMTAEPPNGLCFDVTPPVITPVVTGTLGNNGWFTSDVVVDWIVVDVDSPITAQSGCGSTTVSLDTTNDTFTCTATSDGGTSSSSVFVKRDATPPTITPGVTGTLGNNGWHTSDVEVSFACGDGTSGVASCTGPSTLTDEGPRPDVIGTAVDEAGNQATTTVSGIKIDKTPPVITFLRTPSPNANGWNNGDVTVSFACADGVSGLFSCPSSTAFTTEGSGQGVTGTAEDLAGNQKSLTVADINIDKTPPAINGSVTPSPNANGWHNTTVTVAFACVDTLSGIDSCTSDTMLNTEGAGQNVTGTAIDLAGNTATDVQAGINIDFTSPTITVSTAPPPDVNGRNDPPVTASFVCSDALSGVAACPTAIVLGGFGFGQNAAGEVMDLAGNAANTSVNNIDIGRPVLTSAGAKSVNEGALLDAVLATVNPFGATSGTASIDWGDGSPSEAGTVIPSAAQADIRGSHVYADDGAYGVEVCVEDLGGRQVCETLAVTVGNESPMIHSVDVQANPVDFGSAAEISAMYNDLGTADTHTATIDWGDGTALETVGVFEAPFGPPGDTGGLDGEVPGSHEYALAGNYAGQVCVTDDENATACASFSITVDIPRVPTCDITIGSVPCAATVANIPLAVTIKDGGNQPATFLWTSDNPDGTFNDLNDNDFDDPTSQTPTLLTIAQASFNVLCTVAFPEGSGLSPFTCQASVTPCLPGTTKIDALLVDNDGNGKVDRGDTIRYTVAVRNANTEPTPAGVLFADTPDANTSLVIGSVVTSGGTVEKGNGAGDSSVEVNLPSIPSGSSITITFDVTFDGVTSEVCNQAFTGGQPSDDPDDPTSTEDPTCTPVERPPTVESKIDTDLTLLPVDMDLRQDTNGPVTTKARFDIFNENEVRFSGTERCITCWDQTLLGHYDAPNHFLLENLHTDKGKARIDGTESSVCESASQTSPLLGVAIRDVVFAGEPPSVMRSARSLVGMGLEAAVIQYDIIGGPGEAQAPGFGADGSTGFQIDQAQSVAAASTSTSSADEHRGSISKKGSVLIFPKVELKWRLALRNIDSTITDPNGTGGPYVLVQDTFIDLENDYPDDVRVQMYFVNGDAPTEAVYAGDPGILIERAHPGWNNVDVEIDLTSDESTYWSAMTGAPKGVSTFTVLDPGDPPGRPDIDLNNHGGRVLRGYVVAWAVDANGKEISWNHLSGSATMVHYGQRSALEYGAWAFQCVTGAEPGQACGSQAGELNLDGVEYDACPARLLLDFYATGSKALSSRAPCDDGFFCNGVERGTALSGCIPGTPPNCDDNDACTVDICDETADVCIHNPLDCDDGIDCTDDSCEPAGRCSHTPNDSSCDALSGPCATGTCDPAQGCVQTSIQNGTACDDGDFCTFSDLCENGACVGQPRDCSDGNDCTTDSCDSAGNRCVNDPECATATDCGDSICINASCDAGCCTAVSACPPSIGLCRNFSGACDEVTGCVEENQPDGTGCDMATGTTGCGTCDGACQSGVCVAPATCPCFDEATISQLVSACTGAPFFGENAFSCDGTDCKERILWQCPAGAVVPICDGGSNTILSSELGARHDCVDDGGVCLSGSDIYQCRARDNLNSGLCLITNDLTAQEFEVCRTFMRNVLGN